MLDFISSQYDSNYFQRCTFQKSFSLETEWPIFCHDRQIKLNYSDKNKLLKYVTRFHDWQWPEQNIIFISDIHADANAMLASLVLAHVIKKTGPGLQDFKLTAKGHKSLIIIGGDCLDKGPSNLELLRLVRHLLGLKPNTILLAGNHDIRFYMGLKCFAQKVNTDSSHFFIRMGKKVLPLLQEVYNKYVKTTNQSLCQPSLKKCYQAMYPDSQWQDTFIQANQTYLSNKALALELNKVNKKTLNFEENCEQYGLNLKMAYQAAEKCCELFLKPGGEFYWFFKQMKLVHREKSFLFAHAGIDNQITRIFKKSGVDIVNKLYYRLLDNDLYQFYYGTIGNLLRTKYRKHNPVLNHSGVKRMHQLGIHALVHGHVSHSTGQNISQRSGLLHFECDVTLDRNSRQKENLSEFGAGATIISRKGHIKAISTDYPQIKVFNPDT